MSRGPYSKGARRLDFMPWEVEAGRVITNGRTRFYLSGCLNDLDAYTNIRQYEPVWLDRLAHAVCDMLNATSDNGRAK